jgi:ketosteroid isomerase-like protein
MTTTQALDGADLVRHLFDRFAAGDVPAAVAKWRDDARWHPVTPSGVDGFDHPRSRDEYFTEILPTAFALLPEYAYELERVEAFGPLVVAHIRSSWSDGGTPQQGEGIMVFRIVDGAVADLYVMNAAGAGIF